ncbi:type VI secretion system tip protein VgrG, partial [Burkholderia multivorans]
NAGRQEERGRGFELATGLWGVVRSAMGMLITTQGRPGADGQVKSMSETLSQLDDAHRLHDFMSKAAQEAEAQDVDGHQSDVAKAISRQNEQIRGRASEANPFAELAEPHLVIAGKAGVQLVTPATAHVAAQQVAVTSEGHVGIASGSSFFASIRDTIRFVAQKGIVKFVSVAGDIVLHALTQSIVARAQKQILLEADEIILRGKRKIRFEVNGSFTNMDASGIVHGTSGKFLAHASFHQLPGPLSQAVDLAPKKICIECLMKAARSGTALVLR